ncbi:MAG: hypothetical protein WC635_05410 [Bacteriovorax sp.]
MYTGELSSNSPASSICVRNKKQVIAGRSEKDCKAAGGRWMGETRGRGRITGCLLHSSDSGKKCNDSKECESLCVDFKCYEWSDYRGCGIIENGKAICVD